MSEPKHKDKAKQKPIDESDKNSLKKEKPLVDNSSAPKPRVKIFGVPSTKYLIELNKMDHEMAEAAEEPEPISFKSPNDSVIEFGDELILGKLLFKKKLKARSSLVVGVSEVSITKLTKNDLVFDVRSDKFHSQGNQSGHDAVIDLEHHMVTFSPNTKKSVIARVYTDIRRFSLSDDVEES